MSQIEVRDPSTEDKAFACTAGAGVGALLMQCCGRTRPLGPEALRCVERLKAACRQEAQENRDLAARAIAIYATPTPAAIDWRSPAPSNGTGHVRNLSASDPVGAP